MTELALHILDIVQNSIRANATKIEVIIEENKATDLYSIEIKDDGDGVDAMQLKQISDPFFTTRTTRKVGLGISLLKQVAEQTGGHLNVESEKGKGTRLKVQFSYKHVDRPILGDIAGTLTLIIGANPQIHFLYVHKTPLSDFEFDTDEIKEELEDVPISDHDILKALKELIEENLELINAAIN